MPEQPDQPRPTTATEVFTEVLRRQREANQYRMGLQFVDLAVEQAAEIARVTGINDVAMINRSEPPSITHLVNAERLLAEILPEELYIQLNATHKFTIPAKLVGAVYKCTHRIIPLKYELFRHLRTNVYCMNGSIYAACIAPDCHGSVPEADRLAAEYLLLVNDERKYLETAHLEIGHYAAYLAGRQQQLAQVQGHLYTTPIVEQIDP